MKRDRGKQIAMLSEQAIEEFRVIYQKKYRVELPYKDAMQQANNLIRLYKAVLPPDGNPRKQEFNLRK